MRYSLFLNQSSMNDNDWYFVFLLCFVLVLGNGSGSDTIPTPPPPVGGFYPRQNTMPGMFSRQPFGGVRKEFIS